MDESAVGPSGHRVPVGAWRSLGLLATAMLLAMSTWFSATAVVPQLRDLWSLGPGGASLLTIAVQVGFVAGAVGSAATGLADRVAPRTLMLGGALLAAAANLALLEVDSATAAVLWRAVTGAALAAVYPPGLKAMSTWFRWRRGLALGVMVGALTAGSALPHLVNGLGGLDWRVVIVTTSGLTLVGGIVARFAVGDGPYPFPRTRIALRDVVSALSDRSVRLATLGYVGHMWELYAMWAWIVVFLAAMAERGGLAAPGRWAAFGAFAAIGVGAAGCVVGGLLADRYGRATAALVSLRSSGTMAVAVGPLAWVSPWLGLLAALVWGFWIVADSAQFSTLVTELADQRLVGTAVTTQLAVGFLLTVVTIWLVPIVVDAIGWRWAFTVLVPGPVAGVVAMRRLRDRVEVA